MVRGGGGGMFPKCYLHKIITSILILQWGNFTSYCSWTLDATASPSPELHPKRAKSFGEAS